MRCSGARLGARVRIHSRTITKPNGIAVRPRIEIPVRTGTRRSAQCPLGRVAARAARDGGNRPSTTEINRRRLILLLPPGSGRSAYRSAAGPVCTGRYGSYRSNLQTMKTESFLKQQPITVLVDTESINNFMDNKVVSRMTLQIEVCNRFEVKVVDGHVLKCD
ncbi:hypothetical protein BHE74_00057307 [Ensete ventricosum]|nr:hypothetical protein BHE74_00057307 [Ensete ventricosum]